MFASASSIPHVKCCNRPSSVANAGVELSIWRHNLMIKREKNELKSKKRSAEYHYHTKKGRKKIIIIQN